LHVDSITPGEHVRFAQITMTATESAADFANPRLAVGRDAVAVASTGGSIEIDGELLATVRR